MPPEVVDEIKAWGRDAILGRFRTTLGHLRVPFDVWKSEASLYEGGPAHRGFAGEVGKALLELDDDGELFDADGAVWLRTTDYGDDKDRVLVRQTGAPTYFLSDIAYHRDKMDRGFDHLIDIWGADHHGYVPRMKAMFTALPPHDPDRLELIIGQLVNLLESGVARRMSKRRGDIVTVDDLIEAIGVDAVRFFMVGAQPRLDARPRPRPGGRAVEQEPGLLRAVRPRAHLQRARQPGRASAARPAGAASFGEVAVGPYERNLVRTLARFPLVVLEAVERRGPHRVHAYLGELAAEFHVFYRNCRVLTDDPDVTAFRAGPVRGDAHDPGQGPRAARGERAAEHVTRRRGGSPGRRQRQTRGGESLRRLAPASALPGAAGGQAAKCSSAYLRSSSACSGLRSRLSPRRCDSARLARPRNRRWTTLSRMVLATSLPGMAGVYT